MANNRHIHVNGLQQWEQALIQAHGSEFETTKDKIMRTGGLRTLEYLDDYSPVKTGRLKSSMSMGHADNYFELVIGDQSHVLVGTNVEYAQAVNDGFKQRKGRFVPGEWRGNTFHYIPGHDSGMVLTGKTIAGARMFERAMDSMEGDFKTIIEFELRRMFDRLR